MDTIINQIALLPQKELKVLCYYAYFGDQISQYDLELFAIKEKKTFSALQTIGKKLLIKGYLTHGEFDWLLEDFSYRINEHYYAIALYWLYTEHPDWAKEFKTLIGDNDPFYSDMRTIIQLSIQQKFNRISPKWFSHGMIPYLVPIATDAHLGMLALCMPESIFSNYFDQVLVYLSEEDVVDKDDVLPKILAEHKSLKASLAEAKESLALYRYYSHGEYTPSTQPKTLYAFLLEAVHAACHQEYSKAYAYFEEALKIRNKTAVNEKNILAGMLNSYFLIMTYVHEGSDVSNAKIAQFLRKKSVEYSKSLQPARVIACCFADPDQKLPLYLEKGLLESTSPRTTQCFGFLFASHYQEQEYNNLEASNYMPQQAILKQELSAYLPLSDEERQQLCKAYGNAPQLSSIRIKPKWELVIENILKEEEEKNSNTQIIQDTRLAYIIHSGNIEVREQSLLKSGKWGSGKAVSSSRYQSGQITCMTDADKKVWARWRKKGYHSMSVADVLPELIGSDRVFTGRSAPLAPVVIVKEKPYMVIEKSQKGFKVSSNFPPLRTANRYDATDCIIVETDKTHYTVIPLEGKERRYYEQLLTLGEFPLEAEKHLQEFIPKMTPVIEVHSSLLKEGSTLEEIDGQASLCLQAHPSDHGFHLQLYAKPLLEGSALFIPGKGLNLVVDEKNGVRYQVKRHLSKEQNNLEALTSYLEEELDVSVKENNVFLTPGQMLTLLDYIQPLPDSYFMEWPEGENLRLKKASQPGKWDINLTSKGRWLDIEGEICLDDETVLSMAKLLELIGQNNGKYIRLNDTDYLRLSDRLQKQLNRLESITVKNHGKMQISHFQAGLLSDDVLNGDLVIKHDQSLEQMRQKIVESKELKVKVPAKLKATLRDYQIEGFQWIVRLNNWGAGACLADDMGLGKTLQTIAYLLFMAKKGASLVIAPASVVSNWRKEIQRFAPALNVSILNESTNRLQTIEQAKAFDVVLSTYGLLVSEESALTAKEWNIICLDEAHTIKNRETKTSASAMKLQADRRLILTGTPIQNHLGELWNLFQFIIPGLLGSYDQFHQKYLLPIEQDKDKQRQQQLNRIVHPFMLRRTKQEVVEELPDKQEIILPVELSEEELGIYEAIRRKAKAMITEGNGGKVSVSALAEISKLRQAACSASLIEKKWAGESSKINLLINLMSELKEGKNRALIFSQFTSFLDLVRKALDKTGEEYLYLDGSTPIKQREKLVLEFQQGDCPFFLISLKAGGLGLNLTSANYIIHLDPWWNPAIEQQATDRAYRIGQEQKVTAYHLVASHTIEEKILRLHETKRNLADALLDGTDMSHKLTAQELMEMLEEQ